MLPYSDYFQFNSSDNQHSNSKMKKYEFKNIHSRRVFISGLIKAGIIINIPFIESCTNNNSLPELSSRNSIILKDVLTFLWPDDGNGPSVSDAKVFEFFRWMFSDPNVDPEEKEYLFKGMGWVDETALEDNNKHFEILADDQKTTLLTKMAVTDWGESWLSKMLNTIIEALFSDPVYGSNTGGISYRWLEHNPGSPRPDESSRYENLLKRKAEKVQITKLDELI
jgi:gluconate 2-dehydrogenase gamma chain